MRASKPKLNGPEHIMNQINVEANVVETEINELQLFAAEELIAELSSAQLALIGGGSGAICVD
jgi:hypothetical protein